MSANRTIEATQRPAAQAIAAAARTPGLAVAGLATIKGALGVVLTSSALARGGAGIALALGPICCGLLLVSADSDEN